MLLMGCSCIPTSCVAPALSWRIGKEAREFKRSGCIARLASIQRGKGAEPTESRVPSKFEECSVDVSLAWESPVEEVFRYQAFDLTNGKCLA